MIIGVLQHALMITGFVLIMMLVIGYTNVQTRGTTMKRTHLTFKTLMALLPEPLSQP